MRRKFLLATLTFNALTAIAGGTALALHINTPPQEWLQGTIFSSYVIPGIVLALIVGGSALLALVAALRRWADAALLSLASGLIMCVWILGEMAAVKHYSWLQLLYMFTGGLLIGLDYVGSRKLLVSMHHHPSH